ncbi:hypothetical protein Ancab_018836 [Ancistrocladus abbreviatus]
MSLRTLRVKPSSLEDWIGSEVEGLLSPKSDRSDSGKEKEISRIVADGYVSPSVKVFSRSPEIAAAVGNVSPSDKSMEAAFFVKGTTLAKSREKTADCLFNSTDSSESQQEQCAVRISGNALGNGNRHKFCVLTTQMFCWF